MTKFIQHLSFFFLVVVTAPSWAVDPIYTPWNSNLAIRGYDPVAYFTENRAKEGMDSYAFEWQGAVWRFSSAENRQLFMASPESYAPQYGGYCAYAVAQNKTAGIDPEQFTIVDGKLYLNYNRKIQQQWLADRDLFIDQADSNWPKILSK